MDGDKQGTIILRVSIRSGALKKAVDSHMNPVLKVDIELTPNIPCSPGTTPDPEAEVKYPYLGHWFGIRGNRLDDDETIAIILEDEGDVHFSSESEAEDSDDDTSR